MEGFDHIYGTETKSLKFGRDSVVYFVVVHLHLSVRLGNNQEKRKSQSDTVSLGYYDRCERYFAVPEVEQLRSGDAISNLLQSTSSRIPALYHQLEQFNKLSKG